MAKRNPTLYSAFGLTGNQFQDRGIPGKRNCFAVCLINAYGDGIGNLKYYKDPNKFVSTALNYLGIARDFRVASILKRSYTPGFKKRSKEIMGDYGGNLYSTIENMCIAAQNAIRLHPGIFKDSKDLKKTYWDTMMDFFEMEPQKARRYLEGRADFSGVLKPLAEIDSKSLNLEQKLNFKKLLSKSLGTSPSVLTRTRAWSKLIDEGRLNVGKMIKDFKVPLYVARRVLGDLEMAGHIYRKGKFFYPNSRMKQERR